MYAQQPWSKSSIASPYVIGKSFKGLLVESVGRTFCQSLRQWRLEHHDASLENETQKVEYFADLQRHKVHTEDVTDTEILDKR